MMTGIMKPALLVIDVQNDMFNPLEKLHNPEGLLKVLQKVIEMARKSGTPVIYIQHNSSGGKAFVNGTEGWMVHEAIKPLESDKTVQKTTPDSFYNSTLKETLDSMGIDTLVITGIQSELCVDTTTRRANSLDYRVVLVRDGHSTFDRKNADAARIIELENEVLDGWFARVTDSGSLDFEKLPVTDQGA